MATSAKKVLDLIAEKEVEWVDLRFTDPKGKWHHLTMTAALLDECVHAGYLQRYVEPAYNRASSVKFADLPKQAQAVVFSICFQKGCGGVRRDWKNTWGYLITQNWPAAAAELQNGFSQYVGRRRDEGIPVRLRSYSVSVCA